MDTLLKMLFGAYLVGGNEGAQSFLRGFLIVIGLLALLVLIGGTSN